MWRAEVFTNELVEWKLVGVNTKAIDPSLVITPETILTE